MRCYVIFASLTFTKEMYCPSVSGKMRYMLSLDSPLRVKRLAEKGNHSVPMCGFTVCPRSSLFVLGGMKKQPARPAGFNHCICHGDVY